MYKYTNRVEVNAWHVFVFFLFQTELKCLNKNARLFFRVCQKCLSVQCADIRDEVRRWGRQILRVWIKKKKSISWFMGCNSVPSAARKPRIQHLPAASHHNTMARTQFERILWNDAVLCSARVQIRSHQWAAEKKSHPLLRSYQCNNRNCAACITVTHRDAMNADTRVTRVSHGNSKCVTQTLNDFFSMLWCCGY